MATGDPSKQTNVRLPLHYHEQLQRAAQQQGKAVGALAKELLMAALDGGDLSPAGEADASVDTTEMMERLDSIEDSIGASTATTHIALRTLVGVMCDEFEAQQLSKTLDATLGPMPSANRT